MHPKEEALFLAEGLAVGALVHGGITLMGANQNAVQSAVIAVRAVVCTLMHGTFDALICFAIHNVSSFSYDRDSIGRFFLFHTCCLQLTFLT